jgi:hypothetical protein
MNSRKIFLIGVGSGVILLVVLALGATIGLHLAPVSEAEARARTSYPERDERVLDNNARWMEACLLRAKDAYKRQLGQMRDLDPHLVMAMALRLYDTSD